MDRLQRSFLLWIGCREVFCYGEATEKFSFMERPHLHVIINAYWDGMAPLFNSEHHYDVTGCCSSCTELLQILRNKAKERAYLPYLLEFWQRLSPFVCSNFQAALRESFGDVCSCSNNCYVGFFMLLLSICVANTVVWLMLVWAQTFMEINFLLLVPFQGLFFISL